MSNPFHSIGFLGGGNMAEAMIHGILRSEMVPPAKITVCDKRPDRLHHLTEEFGIGTCDDPWKLLGEAELIVLAVKPQDVGELLAALTDAARAGSPLARAPRFITICAGVSTARLERELGPLMPGGETPSVVRVMPNTPALIDEGAAVVAGGTRASRDDIGTGMALMDAVGLAIELPEEHMDAVTALSGSGPAYVFALVEEMIKAGEAVGLPFEAARRLTLQTVVGAALLARDSEESASELRRRVTSKGGTTEAAIDVFHRYGFADMIREAVRAARDRAIDLDS
jgi:pyrroline-5-carboxylate reductase